MASQNPNNKDITKSDGNEQDGESNTIDIAYAVAGVSVFSMLLSMFVLMLILLVFTRKKDDDEV